MSRFVPTLNADTPRGFRKCGGCLRTFPLTDEFFHRQGTRPSSGGFVRRCKECAREASRAHNAQRTQEQRRRAYLWENYRITPEEYDEILQRQGGGCALCGRSDGLLHVDHDHERQVVRGILCFHCNTALGKLGDNVEAIERVLEYLR